MLLLRLFLANSTSTASHATSVSASSMDRVPRMVMTMYCSWWSTNIAKGLWMVSLRNEMKMSSVCVNSWEKEETPIRWKPTKFNPCTSTALNPGWFSCTWSSMRCLGTAPIQQQQHSCTQLALGWRICWGDVFWQILQMVFQYVSSRGTMRL